MVHGASEAGEHDDAADLLVLVQEHLQRGILRAGDFPRDANHLRDFPLAAAGRTRDRLPHEPGLQVRVQQVDGLIGGLGVFRVRPLGDRAIRAVRAFRHAIFDLAVLEAVAQFPQQRHAGNGIGGRADDGLGHPQGAGSRLAHDLAVSLLRQLQAVFLVLDDDQPFEPFIEVGDLVLAGLERMVAVRVRHTIQFMRPFLEGVAALGALPLVVLPADSFHKLRQRHTAA